MKEGFIINESGVRTTIPFPENAVNMTESYNSSRTVALLQAQHKEVCKQNQRVFILSIITSIVSIAALVVSIVTLFLSGATVV